MATADYQPIRGMSDIAPPEVYLWQEMEAKARNVLAAYGFDEVRTPSVELTSLFSRSLGEGSDVVQKEMYAFDRSGDSLALRPEGTAGIMRYVGGAGPEALDARIYYWGPMFRAERPQAGRKRQFHQVGAESLGAPNPALDAESIALQLHLLDVWGVKGCKVQINTRGSFEDHEAVLEGLRQAIEPHLASLPDDDKRRYESNVMRVLDSKEEKTRKILADLPPLSEFMSEASRTYLDDVLRYLAMLGIEAEVNPRLVRGFDYYEHTVWEITHGALGAQDALSGGGRYRFMLKGKAIEGVGFALGIERVIMALEAGGVDPAQMKPKPDVWIVGQGERVFDENLVLLQTLRQRGVAARMDLSGRSMKAQMRVAGRSGARYVVIRGEQELEKGVFMLKDMGEGEQEEVEMPELMTRLTSPLA